MGKTVKEIEDRFLSFLLDEIGAATGTNLLDPDGPDRERLIGFVRRLHSENIRLKGAIDFEKLRNHIDVLENERKALLSQKKQIDTTCPNCQVNFTAAEKNPASGDIYLTFVNPDNIIPCIKLVRELTGFGLNEAKDLVDKVRGRYYEIFIPWTPAPAMPQKINLRSELVGVKKNNIVNRFIEIGCKAEIR